MPSRPGDDTEGTGPGPGAASANAWRRARPLLLLAALAGLADLLVEVLPLGTRLQVALHNALQLSAAAGAAWICLAEAGRHEGRARTGWRLVGAGAGAWAIGTAIWSWYEVVLGVAVPLPGASDVAYLLFYPLAGTGLLLLAPLPARPLLRAGLVLDGLLAALAATALAWPVLLHDVVHVAETPLAAAVTIAYPVADIVLLGLVGGVLMRSRHAVRSGLGLAYLAFWLVLLADLGWTTGVFAGSYATGQLSDAGWILGFLVLAAAARAPMPVPQGWDERYGQVVGHVLPLTAALAAAVAYLLGQGINDHGPLWHGLLASVFLLAALRQGLAAWEYDSSVRESLALQTDYKALFDNMAEGFAHGRVHYEGGQAVDFEYLRVNSRFGPLTGLHDVVGRRVSQVVPRFRETNQDLLAMFGRVAMGGRAESAETEVPGIGRWFRITAYSAGPGEFVAVFDNITERKGTERRLSFQARLLDSVGQAVIATDAGGRITYWGPGAEVLYGWRSTEVMGRPIVEVTPTEASQSQGSEILASLGAGRSWSGEFTVRRKDGSPFIALVRNDPVFDDERRLVGVIGVSQDISAMKQLESDLKERVKERNALSRVAMHGAQSDDLASILREAVHALEAAFLHPDPWVVVSAGGLSAHSQGQPPDGPELRSGGPEGIEGGSVAVRYRSKHEDQDIGPFLHEEQLLVDSVADLLATFVARQRASDQVRFQAHLLQSVSQAVTATDIEGRVTYWNPAATKLFGWAAAEAIGHHISELWGEALVPASGDGSSGGAQGDHFITLRDGRTLIVNMASSALLDRMGALEGFITITQDVTAERKQEVQLRDSEARLREAQRLAHIGAWELDVATNDLWWSEETYRIFGVEPGAFGATYEFFLESIHPEDRAAVHSAYQTSLQTRRPYTSEHRLRLKDGTIRWVLERGQTLYGPDGKPTKSVGTTQDITERKQAEEARRLAEAKDLEVKRLEELNKMRMEFLNTAAHDLKTPLTPLRLAMGTLRLGSPSPDQKASLDLMERNIARFQALVEDMLDAARLQAGRLKLKREAVSPSPLVEDAVASFQESARQAGLTLRVSTLPEARIDADPLKVMQVLMNLVSNAVKYTPSGGQILVEASTTPREWEFRVRDSGLGMGSEQLARLFQPFVRLHEDVPGTAKGTGLGLYISKGIVEQHGGRLWAESEGPGHGSTFHVALPLASSEAVTPTARGDPKAA